MTKNTGSNNRKEMARNRGMISPSTLLMMAAFATAGVALLETQITYTRDSDGIGMAAQAKFNAESALQEAKFYVENNNQSFKGTSPEQAFTVGGKGYGSYDYTVTQNGNVYSVTANGYYPSKSAARKYTSTLTSSFTYVGGVITAPVGVIALSPSASSALTISGNGEITVYGGKVYVDSSSKTATVLTGNASIVTPQFDYVGGYSISSNASIQGTLVNLSSAQPDPYANLAVPDMTTMTVQSSAQMSISGNSSRTLSPGVYTGGLSLGANSNVTLKPGIYYLNGGGLSVTGNAVLTGNGVMIYAGGTTSSDVISMTGNGSVTLTPPTSGTYSGLVVWQDRANANTVSFGGNAQMKIRGSIYAAGSILSLSGNGNVPNIGSSDIANTIVVSGNGNLSLNNY